MYIYHTPIYIYIYISIYIRIATHCKCVAMVSVTKAKHLWTKFAKCRHAEKLLKQNGAKAKHQENQANLVQVFQVQTHREAAQAKWCQSKTPGKPSKFRPNLPSADAPRSCSSKIVPTKQTTRRSRQVWTKFDKCKDTEHSLKQKGTSKTKHNPNQLCLSHADSCTKRSCKQEITAKPQKIESQAHAAECI